MMIARMIYQNIVEKRVFSVWHIANLWWRVSRDVVAECVEVESRYEGFGTKLGNIPPVQGM